MLLSQQKNFQTVIVRFAVVRGGLEGLQRIWHPPESDNSSRSSGDYSWIGHQKWSHKKSIYRETERVTVDLKLRTKSSR